jgi:hypothetical protein
MLFNIMLVTSLKIFIVTLPLMIYFLLGFTKWRKHYGTGSPVRYFFRYVTQERATDDKLPAHAIKIAVFLGWFVISTSLLF